MDLQRVSRAVRWSPGRGAGLRACGIRLRRHGDRRHAGRTEKKSRSC